MNEPPNTAVYRRVSTDQQDSGLETQESELDRYIGYKKGLVVTEETTILDNDTSGSIPIHERPGGARLFQLLKAGAASPALGPKIKHLVVAKVDRLGRNASDLLQVYEELDDLGVVLHIVNMNGDSFSTQGAYGRMMLQILAVIAEVERAMIRERIQGTANRKFAEHKFMGGAPKGYKGDPTPPYGYDFDPADNCRLVDNFAEQAVIRRMDLLRGDRDNGGPGLAFNAIAKVLNAEGIRTKKGCAWQSGNVAGTLQTKPTARLLAPQDLGDLAA
jgi:site-specific DNA recombinase